MHASCGWKAFVSSVAYNYTLLWVLIYIFVFHIFVHKSSDTIKARKFAVTVLPSGDYTVRSSCVDC